MEPTQVPHFDWSINFGQIAQGIGIVFAVYHAVLGAYRKIQMDMAQMKSTLQTHAKTLSDHSEQMARSDSNHNERMTRYETAMFQVVSDLQRVVGRVEALMPERRREH